MPRELSPLQIDLFYLDEPTGSIHTLVSLTVIPFPILDGEEPTNALTVLPPIWLRQKP